MRRRRTTPIETASAASSMRSVRPRYRKIDCGSELTTDAGRTWQNVTPPALTSWSRVTMVEASHFDMAEAYATVDRHQLNDFDPHVYRTRDGGKTWQEVTQGLVKGAYLHTVKEDPQ